MTSLTERALRGALLFCLAAVRAAPARGGIAGRRLILLSRDDESRPERAIGAARELAGRSRAVALIGGYVDSLVGPVAEVADRARVPYLATASLVVVWPKERPQAAAR